MAKNVTPPLQFSLSELIATVAMTFIGMVFLVPALQPLSVFAASAITAFGTFLSALIAVNLRPKVSLTVRLSISLSAWSLITIIGWIAEPGGKCFHLAVMLVPATIVAWSVRPIFKNSADRTDAVMLIILIAVCSSSSIALFSKNLEWMKRPRFPDNAIVPSTLRAIAEAEEIYHRTDYDCVGTLDYAQDLKELIALIDPAIVKADGQQGIATPYQGYLFRIIKGQGKNAPGGARSFINDGHMTLGYAIIAYPAQYDVSGRDCFMISHSGTIYQADLGPNTTKIISAMTEFDPVAPTWTTVE